MRTAYVVVTTGEPGTGDVIFDDEAAAVEWMRWRDKSLRATVDQYDPAAFHHVERRQVD